MPGIEAHEYPSWEDHNKHLEAIYSAALDAADPFQAVLRNLQLVGNTLSIGDHRFNLRKGGRILVVGTGKAAVGMARAVEQVLGSRLDQGVLAVYGAPQESLMNIECVQGGHPLPSEGSLRAGVRMQDLLSTTQEGDLVLALISGGGSALLELPLKGVSLGDLKETYDQLIKCGMPIHELNVVRRHLSVIKGGGLARMAAPAPVAALILSDVVGDRLSTIASGLTTPNPEKTQQAIRILEKYTLWDLLPETVRKALVRRSQQGLPHLGKPAQGTNFLVGSNRLAALEAVSKADALGFRAELLTTYLEGEAREVGKVVAGLVKGLRRRVLKNRKPGCWVMGGETTVTVHGEGQGGRNQELALSAAIALEAWDRVAVMALATDGVDGPTPAAGAIITGETLSAGRRLGLDAEAALAENDAYPYLRAVGGALVLGPTGTNVNDLIVCLAYARA